MRSDSTPSGDRHILIGLPCDGGDTVAGHATALADRGWRVTTTGDAARLIALAATRDHALCWLCGSLPAGGQAPPLDPPALAARIARLPAPRGLLPMLSTAAGAPPPSDNVLHAAIAAAVAVTGRTGPAPPDPVARLAAVFGPAAVARLATRFRDRLVALIAAPDPHAIGEGTTAAMLAHRLAGLAGTLAFAEMSEAWVAVETHGPAHLPAAWLETRIACAMLDLLLVSPPG